MRTDASNTVSSESTEFVTILKSRRILPIAGALIAQVMVLGALGSDVDLPMTRVPLPTFVLWCLPAALTVGLVVESHTEDWDCFNRVRVTAVEIGCGLTMGAASLLAFVGTRGALPPSHSVALWIGLLAVGVALRSPLGEGSWFVVLVLALVAFYELGNIGSHLMPVLTEHAPYVMTLSAAVLIIACWKRSRGTRFIVAST